MEKSNLVLGLLEATLGSGKKDRKTDNYSFHCPFCKHHKPKLVVNVDTGNYNCWTCSPATKGKNPVSLLKKLRAPIEHIKEMASYFSVKIKTEEISDIQNVVSLPTEFVSLLEDNSSLDFKRAKSYLKSRGITTSDIQKYNIGYCQTGRYQDRIIVPSYDNNGVLNYFIARSLDLNSTRKYDAPSCKKAEIV
jgi:DNA primase